MPVRFTELAIDAREPRAIAEWWARVLDYELSADSTDDVVELVGPEGSGPTLVFARVPESKSVKNRVHLDLNARGTSQATELQRLLDLGATTIDVGQGPDVDWIVLADPEGNEFCLLHSTVN
jgi:Glyoxalase-like domain